jgi:N4-gp56 family major capsid protein
MQIFYDRKFLERAKSELRHDFGATVKVVPMNSGKTVYFNRFTPLAVVTTALSEGPYTAAADLTSSVVSATLAEYGQATAVYSLFEMTSLDTNLAEHVDVMGQNAGESIDQLIRAELAASATGQTALGKTDLSNIGVTDTLTGLEIRKAVRTLKVNKAPRFPGGMYRGIIGPQTAMDLMGNSEWLDAHRYTNADAIMRGVVGKLHGVEFVETTDPATVASTVTVYYNFIFGANAYAVVGLGGAPSLGGANVAVKTPGPNSTNDPLNMVSTIGWKVPFAVKVLNANWIINVKTGATA